MSKMSTISLITDFGFRDNFVGVIKAVILKINPDVNIVDISHGVKPQDIQEAAFLLKSSFRYFPYQTVHLVVVDPGVGSDRKKILLKTKNYFFIGPDNGVFAPALADEPPLEIIEITNQRYFLKPTSSTFHGRDIFAPVAAYLTRILDKKRVLHGQGKISNFGKRVKSLKDLRLPEARVKSLNLTGEIIYIDHFGNLVSNIDKDTLDNFIKNKKYKICIKNKTINKLSHGYSEGSHLQPFALVDSFNYLEIAINGGSASNYLGVDKGTKINIIRSI